MSTNKHERNKRLVIEGFDTLFNKRDYEKAEKFWSPGYIQHSAHIGPGRDGLFSLIKSLPSTLRYEHGLILADDEYVIVHGRFSGQGGPAWVTADILRIVFGTHAGTTPGRWRREHTHPRKSCAVSIPESILLLNMQPAIGVRMGSIPEERRLNGFSCAIKESTTQLGFAGS
jgi:predicted SnoaL-like aldol condensation-catalyzing enzyme